MNPIFICRLPPSDFEDFIQLSQPDTSNGIGSGIELYSMITILIVFSLQPFRRSFSLLLYYHTSRLLSTLFRNFFRCFTKNNTVAPCICPIFFDSSHPFWRISAFPLSRYYYSAGMNFSRFSVVICVSPVFRTFQPRDTNSKKITAGTKDLVPAVKTGRKVFSFRGASEGFSRR